MFDKMLYNLQLCGLPLYPHHFLSHPLLVTPCLYITRQNPLSLQLKETFLISTSECKKSDIHALNLWVFYDQDMY